MRRSICYAEPNNAIAGEVSTWKFCYTTAAPLPKGTKFRFDLLSQGRETDWELPQVNLKEKKNLIWGSLHDGKAIAAKEITVPDHPFPSYEFALHAELKVGETFHIYIGTPERTKEEQAKKGNRAQTNIQRRRPFNLFIDPKGKGDYKESEMFAMDIRGGLLENIKITGPSIVSRNKRFDVVVRFEDEFGNLTNNAPEGTLIELSYEHLRENLNWKLFVPETGFLTLPNLYFNEPGVYRIQLRNAKTNEMFFSAPIKCFSDMDRSVYWGLLHGESERLDSAESIESCLRHFRDEKALQFFATSPFESAEETSNEVWKNITNQIAEANEDHRFTAFLGFQWFGDEENEGLRQILYAKDQKPILRKKDSKTNGLKKIYKSHNTKDFISIPCFTMAKGFETALEDFTPEYERVVEIYNAWGSSECLAKEGNPRPITSSSRSGVSEKGEGSIRKALNRNCRFGFIAGGYDDRGVYSELFESDQKQYSAGLTAIMAIEQTREALYHALHSRNCYATTGARIIIGFSIAGAQMGSELNTKTKPGLVFNRHISGYIVGTAPIKEVILFRNGEKLLEIHPDKTTGDFAVDDSDPIEQALLNSPDERPPFVYYYLRVIQDDGHIGWSSPIWVDAPGSSASSGTPKKAKTKKS